MEPIIPLIISKEQNIAITLTIIFLPEAALFAGDSFFSSVL